MQVEHKTEKGTVLFLKIESDYKIASLNDGHIYFWSSSLQQQTFDYPLCVEIPNGNFEYIGLTSDVIEDQCMAMIDTIAQRGGNEILYRDYLESDYNKYTNCPQNSFKSLMQHLEVYVANPFEKIEEKYFYQRKDEGQSWGDYFVKERIKAQERTGKWLVLFKPNEK